MPLVARSRMFLLALWLSLATVFAHAVLPVGSPLVRGTGSAFSISTIDVALNPGRRSVAEKWTKQAGMPAPDEASGGTSAQGPEAALAVPSGLAVEHRVLFDTSVTARDGFAPAGVPAAPYRARAPPLA